MRTIKGKYAEAIIYTDEIEETALEQIKTLLEQPFIKDTNPRFMPDVHAGKGCTIGTTLHVKDAICPNLVGVDIGCGMLVVPLEEAIDLEGFDTLIHETIPSGRNVHSEIQCDFDLERLHCYPFLSKPMYLKQSIGSLGGGNHFIEVDVSESGKQYLVIHTGSRNLGTQVCDHYMRIAQSKMEYGDLAFKKAKETLIQSYKENHQEKEISKALKQLEKEYKDHYDPSQLSLATLSNQDMQDYLDDMKIVQEYAKLNRETIANIILEKYFGKSLSSYDAWHCIHNYIDIEHMILRKGAISAQKGERVIIPLNMRDGCILGIGKGNPDWNTSGPHGAGRKMSRSAARNTITLESFQASMKGIYSTTINNDTIDEAPNAYKNAQGIIDHIKETIDVLEVIKPIYNFKASE